MDRFYLILLFVTLGGKAECNTFFPSAWKWFSGSVEEEPSENDITSNQNDTAPDDIFFTLLKPNNQHIPISRENSSDYLRSIFEPEAKTKFIVHGWLGSQEAYIVRNTGEEYVKNQGGNIVAVDWSILASWKIYPLSALNVASVGAVVGEMVEKLVESGATSVNKVHLIGHSLGAHIMGIAGASIKHGKVSRITGLDPAKPGFEHIVYENQRLDSSDAEFVDVIHTAAGAAGFYSPIGHVDFYPNGGSPPQPGCFEPIKDPLKLVGCSHGRSYEFFGESIENPKGFMAVKCETWNEFSEGKCANNTIAYMGDAVSTSSRGIYYLTTNSEAPFAKGKKGLHP